MRLPPTLACPPMSSTITSIPNHLRIWQQNINKSRVAQEDLINSDVYKNYNLMLLQEPFIDSYGNTKATKDWWVTYPSHHLTTDHPVCSVITNLDTNSWVQHSIPGSKDLTAIQFKGNTGTINVYNIYSCHNDNTMEALDLHMWHQPASSVNAPSRYMLWCGDFNWHHPLWDEEHNHHLFMAAALWAADGLLEKVLAYRMLMILPKVPPRWRPNQPRTGPAQTMSSGV